MGPRPIGSAEATWCGPQEIPAKSAGASQKRRSTVSGASASWCKASPITRSTCSIRRGTSPTGTAAPSASKAILPMKSSASIFRSSTRRRTSRRDCRERVSPPPPATDATRAKAGGCERMERDSGPSSSSMPSRTTTAGSSASPRLRATSPSTDGPRRCSAAAKPPTSPKRNGSATPAASAGTRSPARFSGRMRRSGSSGTTRQPSLQSNWRCSASIRTTCGASAG